MAARLLVRLFPVVGRGSYCVHRCAPPAPPARGLFGFLEGKVPTDDEQATGLERKIMEAAKLGLDPYSIQPPKNYPGTKEEPTLVPSVENKRLVACLCEEDSTGIAYFWLHEGDSQRCHNCGSYYKLVPQEMP